MRQLCSYAVSDRCCCQLTVVEFGLVKSRIVSLGRQRVGHLWRMWCAVWLVGPRMQAADGHNPKRCMLALNRLTPVGSRFRATHSLQCRSALGGSFTLGVTLNWVVRGGVLPASSLWITDVEISHAGLLHGGRKGGDGRSWKALFTSL